MQTLKNVPNSGRIRVETTNRYLEMILSLVQTWKSDHTTQHTNAWAASFLLSTATASASLAAFSATTAAAAFSVSFPQKAGN